MSKFPDDQRHALRANVGALVNALEQKRALRSCALLVKLMLDRGQMDAIVGDAEVINGYRSRLEDILLPEVEEPSAHKGGRPPIHGEAMVDVYTRLPREVLDELDSLALGGGVSRSQIIRELVMQALDFGG